MIIDAFFEFFKQKIQLQDFVLIKQNLQLKDQKQNTIVISESSGIQPKQPSLIGESSIDIVVLSKSDELSYKTANEIAEKINNRFNIKFTLGEKVYKFLSVIIDKRPLQVGYNGYSYQYNINLKLKYAEIS